jgi:hypothetical protein
MDLSLDCEQVVGINLWFHATLNIFERKVYRRILGVVYDSDKEKWRILTNKEIYDIVKKYPL